MRVAKRFLVCATFTLAACASPRNVAEERAQLRADSDDAYAIAASLVAEVGPRFAGTSGDGRAVRWAVEKMTELGFSDVRTEAVTVPVWERGPLSIEVRMPHARALDAVALGGSVPTPDGGIEAAVLAVPSVEALEALPDSKVKGKVVFYTTRMERTRDGAGYEKAVVSRRKGPATAGRKGAVAVLIRSIGTDPQGRPHTGTTKYEDGAPKIPAAALAGADADALEQVAAKGKVKVRMSLRTRNAGEARSFNVIGEIPGKTDEIVLLGAHLDSWDITPGANDDAAGVGIMLAAARRVAALGTPVRTIRVVLFANEEFGASGAKAYAAAHAGELARHLVVMEADSGSGMPWRLNAGVADADWPWVAQLATDLGLAQGGNGKEGGTDVEPVRKLGVPEVVVTQDGSLYFDVHHTAADTVERLDRAGISQAAGVFAVLVHAASERDTPLGRLQPKP